MTGAKFPGISELTIDKDYSVWSFDFLLSISLEFSTKKAIEILPEGLSPHEVDADNALLNISVVRFVEDTRSLKELFSELVCGIQVVPRRLNSEKELPQMGLYILNLGANNNGILENLDSQERSLFMDQLFQIKTDSVRQSVECCDQDGFRFFSMNIESREITYVQEMFHVRMYCSFCEELFYSDLFFDMNRFKHQGKISSGGELQNHPLFHPLKFDDIKTGSCYGQFGLKPGTVGKEYCLPFKPLL
jgi:hypothetical protein